MISGNLQEVRGRSSEINTNAVSSFANACTASDLEDAEPRAFPFWDWCTLLSSFGLLSFVVRSCLCSVVALAFASHTPWPSSSSSSGSLSSILDHFHSFSSQRHTHIAACCRRLRISPYTSQSTHITHEFISRAGSSTTFSYQASELRPDDTRAQRSRLNRAALRIRQYECLIDLFPASLVSCTAHTPMTTIYTRCCSLLTFDLQSPLLV